MKLIMFSRVLLTALAVILFGCEKRNEETVTLKLKFVSGEVDRVFVSSSTTGQMKIQNVTQMSFTIDSVKENKNVINAKVLRISSETDMFGEKESYDSRRNIEDMTEDEKEMHLEFKDVLDKSFVFSIDNKGNVLENFKDKLTNSPSEEVVDVSNIFIPFPDEPVKIGSEWKRERINSFTKGKTISTYKVTNITDTEIIISIVSEIGEIGGVLAKNTAKGEYVLDKKTCKLKTGEFMMDLQAGGGKAEFKFAMQK